MRTRASEAGIEIAGAEATGSGIVTLRMPKERLAAVVAALAVADVVVKDPGPDCEPLRAAETVTGGFLRISAHVYNTADDIDRVFEIIRDARAAS